MNSFSRYLRSLKKVPRVLRHLRRNAAYVLNDESYWDEYSREWSSDGKSKVLGEEWTHQEDFLEVLQKYSSNDVRALEIGCGGGRIAAEAVRWFGHVHACDVSRQMLERCRQSVQAPNISFHRLDGFTLAEFPESTVDLVYSHDVFVHFSSLQVYPYFGEIRRVLKPGGIGVISFTEFSASFKEFKETSQLYWSRRWFPPHMRIHFITREMVGRMLDDLGLETCEMTVRHYLVAAFRKPVAPAEARK